MDDASSLHGAIQEHVAEQGPLVGWLLITEVAHADGRQINVQTGDANGEPCWNWTALGYLDHAQAIGRAWSASTLEGDDDADSE